jgi:hypothetical protein
MTALRENAAPAWATLRNRLAIALIVLLGVGVVVMANIHLVYVAFASQPECVVHLKDPGPSGTYAAAKSAC